MSMLFCLRIAVFSRELPVLFVSYLCFHVSYLCCLLLGNLRVIEKPQ